MSVNLSPHQLGELIDTVADTLPRPASGDHLGMGYFSLAALGRFPSNELKIDRSLVAGVDT